MPHSFRTTSALLLISCLTLTTSSLATSEFHVALSGNDTNPGTTAKPFATLARAQEAVRHARAATPDEAATVTIQSGRYEL